MDNKISIQIINNIEDEKYSDFISNNRNTSVFQTSEMAEVYKRNKNATPLIIAAIDENTGEIVSSLLAKILVRKPGFMSSFSKHSSIRGGPVFKESPEGINATAELLKFYNEYIKREVLYSRIYPLTDPSLILKSFEANNYKFDSWNNFLIDLNRPFEEIWKDFDKYKRKSVNRAEKKGVTIEEMLDESLVPLFYDLLKETYIPRKQPLEDISHFKAVYDILVPKKMAKFFLAKYDGKYIAGRLALAYKGTVYDWYTGSSKETLSLYPNDLLVSHILKWGSENVYKVFDFGGGGTSEQSSEGWVEFKKRFGAKQISYGRYTAIHQSKKLWFAEKAYEVYRRVKYINKAKRDNENEKPTDNNIEKN